MKKTVWGLVFAFSLIFSLSHASTARAKERSQVIFINQVRGRECCHEGSLDHLKTQVRAFADHELAAHFALRYDVLTDRAFTDYLTNAAAQYPGTINTALLLEITPRLAQDAGISYRGNNDDWYKSQHIFTIGYSPSEREKVLDHLFETYFNVFGRYPELTVSWMIDTPSLNYISEKYGVRVHQVTREQWGTDSYTLYGGPPHYPFPAGRKWLMVPDYERTDGPLIVRQTVTDPLLNYGDQTSAFTSQPNDYKSDGKSFGYFIELFKQALNQQGQQQGFALLGLENSMGDTYQEEFVRQIEYAKELVVDHQADVAGIDDLIETWRQQPVTLYHGRDLTSDSGREAFWITTPRYRARLRKEGQQVYLNDLRLFDPDYRDPYQSYQAKENGYWIMPYLIDGSQEFTKDRPNSPLDKLFRQGRKEATVLGVRQDAGLETSRLVFPKTTGKEGLNIGTPAPDTIAISYRTENGKTVRIEFTPDNIVCQGCRENDLSYLNRNPAIHPIAFAKAGSGFALTWVYDGQAAHRLNGACGDGLCRLSFMSDATLLPKLRKQFYPLLFPESQAENIDGKTTVFFVHNRYAIAGRNPVRIVFRPRDQYNLPTSFRQPPKVTISPAIGRVLNLELLKDYHYYVDIVSDEPATSLVDIELKEGVVKRDRIYFAPNCKQDPLYCLLHPRQAWWYAQTIIRDKIRLLISE